MMLIVDYGDGDGDAASPAPVPSYCALSKVAKGSKHTHEVSSVMELTARRLVEEDRAEIRECC